MLAVIMHPSDELYGADKVLLEIVASLPTNWNVEVWLPDDIDYPQALLSAELRHRGVVVRKLSLPVLRRAHLTPAGILRLIQRIGSTRRSLAEHKPDFAYLNTSALGLVAPILHGYKVPTIIHVHEYLTGLEGMILRLLFSWADAIVSVSRAVADQLGPRLAKRVRVLYNGFVYPDPLPLVDTGIVRFLLASRWNAWKGHALLLQAWAKVQRVDAELVICGGPPLSGQSVDVVRLVSALPNRHTVRIVGETTDIWSQLGDTHVVLVPSIQPDPLPTIAIEGLAAARAVFCSRSGGLPELVNDHVSGRLVPPGDIAAWHSAIESADFETIQAYGRNGRESYEQRFTSGRFREAVGALCIEVARA